MKITTDILARIKKLLNITNIDSNATIHEATNAMELAQKLIKKHHLSMSKVMAFDDGCSASDYIEIKEEVAVKFKANVVPVWMMNIIISVNYITTTKTLINRTPRKDKNYSELDIVFLGDHIDAITASDLFNFLRKTTQKLSSKHVSHNNGKFKQWRSFAEGCSLTLLNRSKELVEGLDIVSENKLDISQFEFDSPNDYEIEDDIIDEQSLVLYQQYQDTKTDLILDYLNDKGVVDEQVSKTTSQFDQTSHQLGIEAGKNIPLKVSKKLTTGV